MRAGERTFIYENKPSVLGCAGVAGKDEKEGPLGAHFDVFFDDDLWGEKTWELTERKMFLMAVQTAIFRASLKNADINFLFGGDLLNQIISAGFAARELKIPFFGLYGACSTMAESLILGALAVDGGYAENVVCATSSHFATAERQYRYPLELGTPKTPTSQHTATASGATVLGKRRKDCRYQRHRGQGGRLRHCGRQQHGSGDGPRSGGNTVNALRGYWKNAELLRRNCYRRSGYFR